MRDLVSGAICSVRREPYWSLFFDPMGPLGAPVWPVPSPGSLEFWRGYGEPVAMMMYVAKLLDLSIRADFGDAVATLNNLAALAAPALVDTQGGLGWGLDSPSLVASMAAMVISERVGGAHPMVCICGVPFLTNAHQSAYCSDRCKNTAHTRMCSGKAKVGRLSIGDRVGYDGREWRVAVLPPPADDDRKRGVPDDTERSLKLETIDADAPATVDVTQGRWDELQVPKNGTEADNRHSGR